MFKRGYLGQFIPERLKKTFNVLMVIPTDVGSDEDREGMHLKGSRELIDFIQRRTFQASFQRAELLLLPAQSEQIPTDVIPRIQQHRSEKHARDDCQSFHMTLAG